MLGLNSEARGGPRKVIMPVDLRLDEMADATEEARRRGDLEIERLRLKKELFYFSFFLP